MTDKEKEVFKQEISLAELDEVNGGRIPLRRGGKEGAHIVHRNIYEGSFPNCAATVGDGSWCMSNDACLEVQVQYTGMNDCSKAWR